MILFFGLHLFTSDLGFGGRQIICNCCGNSYKRRFIKEQYWFTLMFIPLFPIGSDYYSHCPICHSGFKYESNNDAIKDMSFNSDVIQDLRYYMNKITIDGDLKYNVYIKDEVSNKTFSVMNGGDKRDYYRLIKSRKLNKKFIVEE